MVFNLFSFKETVFFPKKIEFDQDPWPEIAESEFFLLIQNVLVEAVSFLIKEKKHHIEIVDFGCGVDFSAGPQSTMTSCFDQAIKIALKNEDITYKIIAYDHNLTSEDIDKYSNGHCQLTKDFPDTTEADIVICYFSVHHFQDSKLTKIEDIIKKEIVSFLNPKIIIIAEGDYQEVSQDEFQETFGSTQAGKKEIAVFGGLQKCYKFHQEHSLSLAVCKEVLQVSNYAIEKVYLGNPKCKKVDENRFIIVAHKLEEADSLIQAVSYKFPSRAAMFLA